MTHCAIKHAVANIVDIPIAAARGALQTLAIENGNIAAAITDKLFFLQQSCRPGNSDSPYSEHVREKFLREMILV
jgi:hypothetical protein